MDEFETTNHDAVVEAVLPAAQAEEEITGLREALAATQAANRDAVERLRSALLASEPDIAPEMVTGLTAAEVEASFLAARETVVRVREKARRDALVAVPAGAPGRLTQTPASALDKIRSGLRPR